MIIGIGDKVKYVARVGHSEVKNGVGFVTDVGDGILEVKDDATGVEYSVWACDADVVLGERPLFKIDDASYYGKLSVQPIDIIGDWPVQQQIGALRFCAVKYLVRLGNKDEALKEARKAHDFTGWLVDVLEGKTINPRE